MTEKKETGTKGKKPKLTKEQKEKIISLWNAEPDKKKLKTIIAEKMGITPQTVTNTLKNSGVNLSSKGIGAQIDDIAAEIKEQEDIIAEAQNKIVTKLELRSKLVADIAKLYPAKTTDK
jgi:Mn-dependent DtxR family transcriptional regulator